ncbi:DUF6498-containing protein [Brevundimonas sp.]|uniref:DUF6498-containing protein n=1 Tax=Brevundimonas sp. TaxID=1871086 RepID=UPI0025F2CC55|nr:DUF6498-containing protein [Brevundimonas sp.]
MPRQRFPFGQPERPARGPVVAAIIVGNLIPIFGVLFLGWSAGSILILYWIENAIVGLFTLPRILMAEGESPEIAGRENPPGRLGTAMFFLIHYGIFWTVHGVFAGVLAASFPRVEGDGLWTAGSFALAVLAMVVTHGLMFWRTWIRIDARRTASPVGEMFKPYGRLIVLHVTVLLGAFGLSQLGAPAWTITLLCVGKMILELGAETVMRLFPEEKEPA